MKTLIELYDERPLENVLGVEMFRPEQVVYICPTEVAGDKRIHRQLREYFRHRGMTPELFFAKADIYDTEAILTLLRRTVQEHPDCAVDITGGTDAVLFAAGLLSAERPIPVFTYSRKKNSFYDIRNAAFAHQMPCPVRYTVEDCFRMAGGSMRTGRVDNAILDRYREDYEPFFQLYLRHRRDWIQIVTFLPIWRSQPTRESASASGTDRSGPGCGTWAAFWSSMSTRPAWTPGSLTTCAPAPWWTGRETSGPTRSPTSWT